MPPPSSSSRRSFAGAARALGGVCVVGTTLAGCLLVDGNPVPTDRAAYPTGLALDAAGERLLVTSSNFDLAYDSGALLLADLTTIRPRLGKADDVVDDGYVDAIALPSFGDRPVLDATGTHVLVTTRGGNLLHEIGLAAGDLSCSGGACGESPHALQLVGNDPFDVLLVAEDIGDDGALVGARGLVTHLSAREAEFFRFNPAANDASRMQVEATVLSFGADVGGVRSSVFVPGNAAADDRIVALVERRLDGTLVGSDLAVVAVPAVDRAGDAAVLRVDLTALTGARSGRDLVVVPAVPSVDGGDETDGTVALVAALRSPDAIARVTIDGRDGTPTVTALADTCKAPTGLALAMLDTDGDATTPAQPRLLLTCPDSEVVQALDPLTLNVTDAVRFYGRAPYDIVVDAVHQEAFVGFFLDNSVGVLRLTDPDGTPRLTPIGRLGTPAPRAEDGRE
jgi:DNA-binding beta-propeller fold protein YncE